MHPQHHDQPKGRLGGSDGHGLRGDGLLGGHTHGLGPGGSGEILALDLGRRRAATVVVDGLLSLGSVLLSRFAEDLGCVPSALGGKVTKLSSLLVGTVVKQSVGVSHIAGHWV